MPHDDPDPHLLADAALVAALLELKESGGQKRYIYCRFSYEIASRLAQSGLITIDSGPMRSVMARITIKGRVALARVMYP